MGSLFNKIRHHLYLAKIFFLDHGRFKVIWNNRKHKVRYGNKNKDKYFYVLRRDPSGTGLLACYVNILGQLIDIFEDVIKGKIIPVIDMYTVYYPLVHDSKDEAMRINAWEHYFKPLSKYSMKDVLESANVTLGYGFLVDSAKPFVQDYLFDKGIVERVLPVHDYFFQLKDELKEKYERDSSALFGSKRILATNVREGYLIRGMEKDKTKVGSIINGHPRQICLDELFDNLEQKMVEWDCDYVFAECQTDYVENAFRKRFGEKFLCFGRKRRHLDDLSLDSWAKSSPIHNNDFSMVKNNIEYLESIFFLSKCTCLYSSKCSGTIVAALWNKNKYEHLEIVNKGLY